MSDPTVHLSDEQFGSLLNSMAERFGPAIEEKAQQAVETLGLGAVERKHALVPGLAGDDLDATGKHQRFFRALLGGDLLSLKALSEGTAEAGGYMVPLGFRDEIIARLPDQAELAPFVRYVPVRTDTGSIPSLATDISIVWTAGASAENQSFNPTDPVLGEIDWTLKRADALTKISRELVADSRPSIVEFVTSLFQEAIAVERDKMIAIGNGTAQPKGLYSTTDIPEVSVAGSLTFAKLVEMEQTLPKKYRRRARWVMNSANLQRVFSLVDSQDMPIFRREMIAGTPESRILGYPVSQQEDLPDHAIFFGDLGQYLWFDREEMGVESTTVGGDAFANHQVWLKIWERADGKLGLADAFVRGKDISG